MTEFCEGKLSSKNMAVKKKNAQALNSKIIFVYFLAQGEKSLYQKKENINLTKKFLLLLHEQSRRMYKENIVFKSLHRLFDLL